MASTKNDYTKTTVQFQKAKTGIQGLDEITGGGFPQGRPTLICGGAGCGKTLMAMELGGKPVLQRSAFSCPSSFISENK